MELLDHIIYLNGDNPKNMIQQDKDINNKNLRLQHIKAHSNEKDIHSIGNFNADKLAYNAIKDYKRDLNKKV